MAEPKKIRVGVLFGGRSSEHEISLRSALTVMSAMDPARYEVVPIGIGRDGRWYLRADAIADADRGGAAPGGARRRRCRGQPAAASRRQLAGRGAGQRPAAPATAAARGAGRGAAKGLPGPLDVVFPVLHGSYGEDGTVQGLLELAGIPYVGAGVLGSAVGMDKDVQKRLLREAGLPVVRYAAVERWQWREQPGRVADLARSLEYPVFVKPNALGSSVGISKVKSESALGAALEDAFAYDRKVLIEAACVGRELECAVLGNERPEVVDPRRDHHQGTPRVLQLRIEVRRPRRRRGQDSRRADRGAERAPARACVRRVSARWGCAGWRGSISWPARRSAKSTSTRSTRFPGFTAISMYPKLWEASGLPLARLIDRLIELALEENRERAALKITYEVKDYDQSAAR